MEQIEPWLNGNGDGARGERSDAADLLKFVELAEHLKEEDPIAAALAAKLGQDAALASVALKAPALLLIDGLDEIGSDWSSGAIYSKKSCRWMMKTLASS